MRLKLSHLLALLGLYRVNATLAPVVGIDLGNEYMKLTAIAPGHNLEMVLNSQSKRKTRSVLNFAGSVRQFGESAFAQQTMQPNATMQYMSTAIGADSAFLESVQAFPNGFSSQWYPYTVRHDNKTRHTVRYAVDSQTKMLYAEEIISHLLSHGKDLLKAHLKDLTYTEDSEVEAVMIIPVDFNYRQRQLFRQAAQIAGFRPVGFLYEPVGAALSHALDIPPPQENNTLAAPPIYKAFFSLGAKNSQICLVQYKYVPAPTSLKDGIGKQREAKEILSIEALGCSVSHRSGLGGHAVDVLLAEAAAESFFATNKMKKAPSARSWRRLLKDATKMKHTLSTNREAAIFVENFANGKDLKSTISRERLETLLTESGYLGRLKEIHGGLQSIWDAHRLEVNSPIQLVNEAIEGAELVGGGWRVPRVMSELENLFKPAPIGLKCNADEAMSVGAAMMAANYSTTYKFKPLILSLPLFEDLSVELRYNDKNGENRQIGIDFGAGTLLGTSVKKIISSPSSPIKVTVRDAEELILDVWTLDGVDVVQKMEAAAMETVGKKRAEYEALLVDPEILANPVLTPEWKALPEDQVVRRDVEVAVVVKLNHMGLVSVSKSAAGWQEIAVEEKADKSASPKTEETTTTTVAPPTQATNSENGEESTSEEEQSTTSTVAPKHKMIFTESVQQKFKALTITPLTLSDESKDLDETERSQIQKPYPMTARQLRDAKNGLKTFVKADREAERVSEMRNRLEAYIYDMRGKLRDDSAMLKTSEESVRNGLLEKLQSDEDWLYEEGFEASFNTVSKRFDALREAMKEAVEKAEEYSDRDRTIDGARSDLTEMQKKIESLKETKNWLTEEHFRPLTGAIEQFEKWFEESVAATLKQSPSEKPIVNRAAVKEKWVLVKEAFTAVQKVKKPKPAPKSEL